MERIVFSLVYSLLFGVCLGLEPLPNIGYLGSGYDILKGNPHATSPEQGVDPGYQAYVFNLAVYNNTITPDNKYNVPFGVDTLLCDFCTLQTESTTISGTSSYQSSLEKEVGGDISIWKFSFGASSDFKQVSNESSSYESVFMETKAECCAYKAEISEYTIPPMSAEFTQAVKSLPLTYNEAPYMKLINYFGTHAVTNMLMGGRFGMRSSFSSNSWSQFESSTIDKKATAKFSLFSFTAAANAMSESEKKSASSYQRFVNNTELFMVGGQITADGTTSSWAVTATENPMPLSITLMPLSALLTTDYFPGFSAAELASKQNAMTTALSSYCNWMLAQGRVSQCTAPGPDPPTPAGSIFAGFYQADDCNKNNYNNPFTNSLSCPTGFSSRQTGRVLTPESKCGANQFVCLKDGLNRDPLNNYGGSYQTADINGETVVNPLTGQFSCPAGYTSVKTGRGMSPATKNGVTQYSCLNTAKNPTYESTAGFYQVGDINAEDRIVNPYTQAPSCPPNYCSVQYGRLMAPEAKSGAVQFVCIACNLVGLF